MFFAFLFASLAICLVDRSRASMVCVWILLRLMCDVCNCGPEDFAIGVWVAAAVKQAGKAGCLKIAAARIFPEEGTTMKCNATQQNETTMAKTRVKERDARRGCGIYEWMDGLDESMNQRGSR